MGIVSPHFGLVSATVLLALAAQACAPTAPEPTTEPAPTIPQVSAPAGSFALASSAFAQGAMIPKKYTCDGIGTSPELRWSRVPTDTRSLALIVDDPDAPGGTFAHWILFDLAPNVNEIAEGAQKPGLEGLNGRGQTGYTGPCPPSGTHRYFFTLYALDVKTLGLGSGATRAEVDKALVGHILAQAQLMGRYSR